MSALFPTVVRIYTEDGRTTYIDDIKISDDNSRQEVANRIFATVEKACRSMPGTDKVIVTPWFLRFLMTAMQETGKRIILVCLCDRDANLDQVLATAVHHMDANGYDYDIAPIKTQVGEQLTRIPAWTVCREALAL